MTSLQEWQCRVGIVGLGSCEGAAANLVRSDIRIPQVSPDTCITPSPFCNARPRIEATPADAPPVRKIDSGSDGCPSRSISGKGSSAEGAVRPAESLTDSR